MPHRRVRTYTLLAALALSVTAITAPPAAAANPPPVPHIESLITEGVTVEGPLVNNVGLPHLL
ncbi:hypothetical protein GCM10009837_60200 [Streptomyces durmitorensis]|uniref:Secreted protein n=1 Tax=Streptomyces durmitorensis TaxID=319947 RepID=A0ABY4PSC9_9ACTN|nr:hypothetical protein [Streptomyces durmitorensis]UQT55911.1 hypothetical protein M4V62_12825 [Streptomyces durmitorensis]